MAHFYILRGRVPAACKDPLEWAGWHEKADRTVAMTELPGGVRVSTVFLGIDCAFGGPPPVLFETMIFGGPHSDYQERYHTWEEAEAGHARACALAAQPKAEGG